jgi:hypothetical protein
MDADASSLSVCLVLLSLFFIFNHIDFFDAIIRLADEGSHKMFQLAQQCHELLKQDSSTSSTQQQGSHHLPLYVSGNALFNFTIGEALSFLKQIGGDVLLISSFRA